MNEATGTYTEANGKASGRKATYESTEAKPVPLAVEPDGIPADLKERPQWVCWRYQQKEGKWTKIPVNPKTTSNAKPNDPTTWGTFAEALALYQRQPERQPDKYAGVGYVISADDPFTGVDLDDARDPLTGDLDPWAAGVLADLSGYQEVSPSGTGAKAIVRAHKPGRRCEAQCEGHKVEIYDSLRFFALTGRRLPASTADVPERQEQLGALYARVFPERPKATPRPAANGKPAGNGHTFRLKAPRARGPVWQKPLDQLTDDDVLQLAREAANGGKFNALWGGDTSGHGGDDSKADAALCSILCYWCRGDAARIERLFRQSSLYREVKWNERHRGDGATYGVMTVEFACSVCTEFYEGPREDRADRVEEEWHRQRAAGGGVQPGGADGEEDEPALTCEIILAHFRELYAPRFRRGPVIYSAALGRPVPRSEACYAPSTPLLNLMAQALDAPRDRKGRFDHSALPACFRNWAPVAFTDLLATLEEEPVAGVSCAPAEEEFRRLVRGGLLTIVALAHGYDRNGEQTRVERKAILEFACSFAKANGNQWKAVRSYKLWSKHDGARVRVALRVEVFEQLRYAPLSGMSQTKFTRLCELYGVGEGRKVKGGDVRAVELFPTFLGDAVDEPADDPTEGGQPDGREGSHTGAHDADAGKCPGEGEPHA